MTLKTNKSKIVNNFQESKKKNEHSFMLALIENHQKISYATFLVAFDYSLKKGVTVNFYHRMRFLFVSVFYMFLSYYNWFYSESFGIFGETSKIFNFGICCLTTFSFIAVFGIVTTGFIGRNTLGKIVEEYQSIENDVNNKIHISLIIIIIIMLLNQFFVTVS